jgi:hypothetical protein
MSDSAHLPTPQGTTPDAARALYRAMVIYLRAANWRREEPGSGWWWKPNTEEAVIGEAVMEQLRVDGIDTREMIDGEPPEFWLEDDDDA